VEKNMETTGGCFCGSIQYTATINESLLGICHCRDCQIFSGSAFRTVGIARPDDFIFSKGNPRYFDKVSGSGKIRRMAFCGECGTHLCSLPSEPLDESSFVSIRVATSKDFSRLAPTTEIFCSSRVSWLTPLAGLAQFPGMPSG